MAGDIGGTVQDVGLVQVHRTTIANIVVADLMGVEAKALKANLGGMKAQELGYLRACDTACGVRGVGVVSIYQGVRVGAVFSKMEETSGSDGDSIAVLQVGVLHVGQTSLDTFLMSDKEDSDITVMKEVLVRSVLWNNAVFVVELHVLEA